MALWCRPRCCCCSCAASSRTARLLSSLRSCSLGGGGGGGVTKQQPGDGLVAPMLKTAVSSAALGANGGHEGNEWAQPSLAPAEEPIPERGQSAGEGRGCTRKRAEVGGALLGASRSSPALAKASHRNDPDALRYGATVIPQYPLSLGGWYS